MRTPHLIEQNIQQYTQGIGQAKQFERQRKWAEMEQVLSKALQVESHHATGHYLLGTALQNQQKYADALAARKKALLLDISRKRTLPSYADIISTVCAQTGCSTQNLNPWFEEQVVREGMDVYRRLYGDHEHLNPDGIGVVFNNFVELILKEL